MTIYPRLIRSLHTGNVALEYRSILDGNLESIDVQCVVGLAQMEAGQFLGRQGCEGRPRAETKKKICVLRCSGMIIGTAHSYEQVSDLLYPHEVDLEG